MTDAMKALEALDNVELYGGSQEALHKKLGELLWPHIETIRAALKAQQKPQVSVYGGATGCPAPEPEVVTENKYLHKYIESVNKIGIGGDCAVYNFLFEMNKRHTKFIRENFPNGLKIVDKEKVSE